MKVLKLKSKQEGMGIMSIIKFIKDSTVASSIVFLGATVGTVGIVSGTALAKPPKHYTPPSSFTFVYAPVTQNVVSVSSFTLQEASSGDVLVSGGSYGSPTSTGSVYSGNVSNTNATTTNVNQTN